MDLEQCNLQYANKIAANFAVVVVPRLLDPFEKMGCLLKRVAFSRLLLAIGRGKNNPNSLGRRFGQK